MKKFLSLVLALVMAMSLVTISAGAADFTDEASIDPAYAEAVELISALGIVSGNNGAFMPQDNLTRGAAAKILAGVKLGADLAAKLPKTSAFSDVAAGSTFAGYISYLKDEGIVGGYGNGTFGPSNKLTGDAFLKQVLGILGYKADIEGYNVTGWQVAVAIDALNAGLLNGMGADFNSAALITREQAAQIIKNALEAKMVEYKNQSSITIGDVVINNASEASDVVNNGFDYKAQAADGKMQLVEKAYAKVRKVENTYDAFMRPATEWKNDGKAIVTFVPDADLTYAVGQYRNSVYTALGLTDDAVEFIRYGNGVKEYSTWAQSDVNAGNATAEQIGQPKFTNEAFTDTDTIYTAKLTAVDTGYVDNSAYKSSWEVYYNSEATTAPKVSIIRIDEYVAKVKSVTAASGSTKRYVTLEKLNSDFPVQETTLTFTTEDFAKGDIVTFTYSKKTNAVVDVALADYKTGTVTQTMGSQDSSTLVTRYDIFVDDFRINAARPAADLTSQAYASVNVGDVINIYLDSNGYYLYVEKVEEAVNYAYVLKAGQNTGTSETWLEDAVAGTHGAQLLFVDGTVEVVETSASVTDLVNDFVTYTINSKGKYVLADVDSTNITAAATVATETGKAALTLNGATEYANNATTYIVQTEKDDEAVFTVYVGFKNIPTFVSGTAFSDCIYAENAKAASFVYIDATELETEDSVEDVIIVNRHSVVPTLYTDANASWYQYNAVVDGAVKSIKIRPETYAALNRNVVFFYDYSIDEDGFYVLSADDRRDPNAYYQTSAKCGYSYVDGLLILGITNGNNKGYYTLDEECVIVNVSGSTTTVWTEADLAAEDLNDYAWPHDIDSDGLVDYLFIKTLS